MKKKIINFLGLFLIGLSLFSQPYAYIGNGTETNDKYGYPTPYGTFYKNQKMQIILTKNELLSAGLVSGNITSIGFNVATVNNCSSMPNFSIKAGFSDKQNYNDSEFVLGLSEVYFNSNYLPTLGWNEHIFTTPIYWDGTKNLIIETCFDIIPGYYTENASVFITNKYNNRSLMTSSDYEPICNYNTGTPYEYVPNVRISGNLASCLPPTNLMATEITNNSAKISWVPQNGEMQWIIEYGPAGFQPGTGSSIIINTIQPFYVLTGLSSNTSYDYYVKAICNISDESYYSGPYTFKTLCDNLDLIYNNNFENEIPFTSLPDCWNSIKINYANSIISDFSPISGNNCLNIYADINSTFILILPKFNQDLHNLFLSFYSYHSWGNTILEIGTISNINDINSFNHLYNINLNTDQIENQILYFSNSPITDGHIALKYSCTNISGSFYIDDVVVDVLPLCPPPIALEVNNITETTCELSWIDSGLSYSWDIEYGQQGFNQGEGILIENINTLNYVLTDLEPQTYYDVYVRSHCSDGYSNWSNKKSFRTDCSYFEIPIIENFDLITNLMIPECWTTVNTNMGSAYIDYYNYFSEPYCLGMYDYMMPSYLISPKINDPIENLRIRFFAKSFNPYTSINVGTISNISDTSTYNPYANLTLSEEYQLFQIIFDNYAGLDKNIAIRLNANSFYSDFIIDNIIIDYIPTCFEPTDLTYSNPQINSCLLSWQDINGSSLFDIEYGLKGFTPGTGILVENVTNPYLVENLESGTYYDFYVRAKCSDLDYSNWSFKGGFNTLCDILDLPYLEDFDSSFELPLCINFYSFYPYTFQINDYNSVSQPNSLVVYADYQEVMFSLPKFSIPVNNLSIKLYALKNSYDPAQIEIGTCSDPNNISTFEVFYSTILEESYNFIPYTTSFSNYSGNNEYIAVKIGNPNYYVYLFIDDISVTQLPVIAQIDPYNQIQPITVCKYTGMSTVLQNLPATVKIKDNLDNEYLCNLSWTVPTYNPNIEGAYPAYGTFNLPQGVVQSDPPMQLQVTTTVNVVVCSAIDDDIINEELFTIYPNPNNGSFRFYADAVMKMEIIDITGAVIVSKTTKIGENYIELGNISQGLYQIRFTDGNILKTVKFIIQ